MGLSLDRQGVAQAGCCIAQDAAKSSERVQRSKYIRCCVAQLPLLSENYEESQGRASSNVVNEGMSGYNTPHINKQKQWNRTEKPLK